MTRPRRPRAGVPSPGARRPGRPAGLRRPRLGPSGPRPTPSATGPRPAGNPLTTRAAILALVIGTLVFSAVLPVREYLRQRSQISAVVAQQAAANARVAALQQQQRELQDPAYVAAEARRRLHMAMPGDITYLVVGPSAPPTAAGAAAAPAAPAAADAPWWSQLWAGVAAGDRPTP